ncbi:MAG: hypothetical protein HY784_06730 [Chloroflexi bacterium]|nr:hypothetical protein [Chloroflexota bacterium]
MSFLRAIYTTRGDTAAVLNGRYIHNLLGEWIGWVDASGQVYSITGEYVGWLTRDPRVLRKRVADSRPARVTPPPHPGRPRLPATFPLPPMMSEIGFDTVDVLDEMPELLHTADFDQRAQDMD